jgi:hypothetical protein
MLVPPADSDSASAYTTFMPWWLFPISELEKFNFQGVILFFQTTAWIEAKGSLVNRPMGLRMRIGTGVHIPPHLPFYQPFPSQLDNTSNPLTRIWTLIVSIVRFPYNENDEVSLDHICDQKVLSMKRLENFFSKEEFKFNSPHTCGHTTIRSAMENMQK